MNTVYHDTDIDTLSFAELEREARKLNAEFQKEKISEGVACFSSLIASIAYVGYWICQTYL